VAHDSALPSVRIALLVEQRYLAQRQPQGLAAELRRRGCAVDLVDPSAAAIDLTGDAWPDDAAVCVARGRSDAVLSRLLTAERLGVPTINRAEAVAAVVDKAGMAVALAGAGIPTPPTVLGSPDLLAAELPAEAYPVVVKPIRGDNCRGLRICGTPADVAGVAPSSDEPQLAQPYLASDGTDLKLYGVGDRVWAVRKPSPLRPGGSPSHDGPSEAVPVGLTPELRGLALECAGLFGLELFGVDCVVTQGGPVVIEVNDFPNYTGIPAADEALADHVLSQLPAAARPDATVTEAAR
jgi:ribosomal protein S6--L-glutamate ligase